MSRVFFDTNVWLPVIMSDGFSRRVVFAAAKHGEVVISETLWNEVAEKLALKFRLSWEQIVAGKRLMEDSGDMFTEKVEPYGASPDPDDAMLLAQAAAARCDFFVTNDKPLLALGAIDAMRIVRPSEFARIIGVA